MYMIVLRMVHIISAVAWAGGDFLIVGFVSPGARALGPEGGRFMQWLVQKGRLPTYMNSMSFLASLSGILLFWQVSGGLQPAWLLSGRGLTLTIGSMAGLLAFGLGHAIQGRAAKRMGEIGQAIAAAGGPPSTAQQAEIGEMQRRLHVGGLIGAVLIAISVVGMAIARYIV
jgi:uncharacterized membrane protein